MKPKIHSEIHPLHYHILHHLGPDEAQSSGCTTPFVMAVRKDGLLLAVNLEHYDLVLTLQVGQPDGEKYVQMGAWDAVSNTVVIPNNDGYQTFQRGLLGFRLDASCGLNLIWNTPFVGRITPPTLVGPPEDRLAFIVGTDLFGVRVTTGEVVSQVHITSLSSSSFTRNPHSNPTY